MTKPSPLLAILSIPCLALSMSNAAYGAEFKQASVIDAVTVFPSGAEVTRLATVKLDKGDHVVLLSDLPEQAIPSSIRVEGRSSGPLEIGAVDTRRLAVPQTDPAVSASQRKRLEDSIEALRDRRSGIQARIQSAETQKALLNNLAQLPLRPGPAGQGAPLAGTDWEKLYALIGTRHNDAQSEILKFQIELRSVARRIKDLEGQLASLAPTMQQRTEVTVRVAAGAPLDAQLLVRYQVSRASWRPIYDARLATGGKAVTPKLTLSRRASISQRSGEDWANVKLVLSTTRPNSGSSAPTLRPLSVDYMPEMPPIRPMASAPEARNMRPQMEKQELSDQAQGGMRKRRMMHDVAAEQHAQVESAPFQALFTIPGQQSIAATGQIKSVKIDETALEPALMVRTVPKYQPSAFLYAKMTMPKGTPYLPGRVLLFRDSTFVGTGHLPLLSPGQSHELGFGQDDSVQVKYAVLQEKRGETGIISSSKTDQRNFKITVRNLHERPIDVTVRDQIPVSKAQDIRVEFTGSSAPAQTNVDDKPGILAWKKTLRPDEEQVILFGYRVTWPSGKRIMYGR